MVEIRDQGPYILQLDNKNVHLQIYKLDAAKFKESEADLFSSIIYVFDDCNLLHDVCLLFLHGKTC
jgi:hypothetical protein